jgi:ribA/ribD-fused uncharacterized protein
MSIIFFYGNGDYYLFSNFYPSKFEDDNGNKYCCSEQFFMKKKQEKFDPNNKELSDKIMSNKNPAQIKSFGRQVRNYSDKEWDKVRYSIMLEALKYKFSVPEFKKMLLDTGNKLIVEASKTDAIWGIGLSKSEAEKISPEFWPGKNLLGKALMETRDYYKQITSSKIPSTPS